MSIGTKVWEDIEALVKRALDSASRAEENSQDVKSQVPQGVDNTPEGGKNAPGTGQDHPANKLPPEKRDADEPPANQPSAAEGSDSLKKLTALAQEILKALKAPPAEQDKEPAPAKAKEASEGDEQKPEQKPETETAEADGKKDEGAEKQDTEAQPESEKDKESAEENKPDEESKQASEDDGALEKLAELLETDEIDEKAYKLGRELAEKVAKQLASELGEPDVEPEELSPEDVVAALAKEAQFDAANVAEYLNAFAAPAEEEGAAEEEESETESSEEEASEGVDEEDIRRLVEAILAAGITPEELLSLVSGVEATKTSSEGSENKLAKAFADVLRRNQSTPTAEKVVAALKKLAKKKGE